MYLLMIVKYKEWIMNTELIINWCQLSTDVSINSVLDKHHFAVWHKAIGCHTNKCLKLHTVCVPLCFPHSPNNYNQVDGVWVRRTFGLKESICCCDTDSFFGEFKGKLNHLILQSKNKNNSVYIKYLFSSLLPFVWHAGMNCLRRENLLLAAIQSLKVWRCSARVWRSNYKNPFWEICISIKTDTLLWK